MKASSTGLLEGSTALVLSSSLPYCRHPRRPTPTHVEKREVVFAVAEQSLQAVTFRRQSQGM